MKTQELIDKINNALQTIAMPDEIRILLIELKDDIPNALTPEEKQDLYIRWMEIILTTVQIVYEISNHT